jgi:hypothetical protein
MVRGDKSFIREQLGLFCRPSVAAACIAIGRAMSRGARRPASWLAWGTAAALTAGAGTSIAEQGTAVLTGTVVSADNGAPIADAVVTVTSPALQGEQIAVTDSVGMYRIPNLPPGTYTLHLDKEHFRPLVRDDIGLRADVTIRFDPQLLPETVQAPEVVVIARAPSIDVGSSATGASLNDAFLRRVPLSPPSVKGSAVQSFESVATAAPGAHDDFYGVGINGTTSPENQYIIDGLTVGMPNVGLIGTPLSIEFLKEIHVITGGYMPEYGRATGGILEAITKTGSNEFHGSVFASVTPGGLEGKRKVVRREGSTIVTEPSLSYMLDFGADIGGPIVQDKLWFYGGFMWSRTRYDLRRTLNRIVLDSSGNPVVSDGFTLTEPLAGTETHYAASAQSLQAIGKLEWAPTSDDRITVQAIGTPYSTGGDGEFGINPLTNTPEIGTGANPAFPALVGPLSALSHQYFGSSLDVMGKWSTAADNKHTIVDTMVGWYHGHGGRTAGDGTTLGSATGAASAPNVWWQGAHTITDFEPVPDPSLCQNPMMGGPTLCPVNDYHTGGAEFLEDQSLDRYQLRSVVTRLFLAGGHHVFKAGFDFTLDTFDHLKGYAGGRDLIEAPDKSFYYEGRQFAYLTAPDQATVLPSLRTKTKTLTVGGFAQDSFNLFDQVTLNAGLRYDAQFLYAGDGSRSISLPNEWSPRIGAIYDFTHEGRSRIFANYARYYESVPLDIMDRVGTGEPQAISAYDPTACDPRDPARPCTGNGTRIPIGQALGKAPNNNWFVVSAGRAAIDPDLKPQSSDELVLGAEYEVLPRGRLGLSYTKRWVNEIIEDMSRDEGNTVFIGNPGRSIAKDFPRPERNYDAVTLYFSKLFSRHWLAEASYTVSYLRGNYSGLFRPEDAQLNPNTNTDFDLRELLVNRSGPLPGDTTHSVKIFAAKDFVFAGGHDVVTGLGFRAHSGEPTSRIGASAAPGYIDQIFITPRGSEERLPWIMSFDLRLGYGFHYEESRTIEATVDVFNLFNFQTETAVDQRYTLSPVQAGLPLRNADGTPFSGTVNPNFGRPAEYQPPRIFRFGLRTTF